MRNRFIGIVSLLVISASSASAGLTLVTSRAALGGDDSVDWGQLGGEFVGVSNPFAATSTGGIGLNGTGNGGSPFDRIDQSSGWSGNFSPGDKLLWTFYPSEGPMDLAFDKIICGAGANIQADFFGDFEAFLEAFDSNGNSLGIVSEKGTSNSNNDGSAIFIGVLSSLHDIASISFWVKSDTGINDFAINQLDLVTDCNVVPSPAAGLLGLLGLAFTRSIRRTA